MLLLAQVLVEAHSSISNEKERLKNNFIAEKFKNELLANIMIFFIQRRKKLSKSCMTCKKNTKFLAKLQKDKKPERSLRAFQ